MFHLKSLGRRNKRILKNKKTVTTAMIMKMKKSNQPQSFTCEQLEVLLKMNRPNFIELVVALKGGSSKGVGFKPAKLGNFDGVRD